jgi:hypothetical protein
MPMMLAPAPWYIFVAAAFTGLGLAMLVIGALLLVAKVRELKRENGRLYMRIDELMDECHDCSVVANLQRDCVKAYADLAACRKQIAERN